MNTVGDVLAFIVAFIFSGFIIWTGNKIGGSIGKSVESLGVVMMICSVILAYEVARGRHNDF